MEAIAAAASIAGIITVVGQSIDGLIKFSDFFSDIASASKTISRLLNDINSLIQVLEDISNVLEQAQARRKGRNLASLDIKLEDCAKDVQIWLATARLLRPGGSDGGGKAWMRKFRLAVNNTAIRTIREEIGRHKQTLCLSLAVFGRTIDIDISAQVHSIGGQFSEALSTMSNHGAHEEALKRIEHYSMTSMHSSAHSIKSMDSIRTELRTELSRLETMITTASNAQPSKVESEDVQRTANSKPTEKSGSTLAETEIRGLQISVSGRLPENREGSSASASGIDVASQRATLNETQNGANSSSQSQRIKGKTSEISNTPDLYIPPTDNRPVADEANDLHPVAEVNKASDLYAEYAKDVKPRGNESPAIGFDSAAIHHVLHQCLASIYPPEVVKYVSLRQITALCEDHIEFLDRRPSIQTLAAGKMTERSRVDSGILAAARPSMVELRDRLVELRKAIKISRDQCMQAGYTLAELDRLLSPPGTGSYALAYRPAQNVRVNSGDDSSSVYSEDFHSPAE